MKHFLRKFIVDTSQPPEQPTPAQSAGLRFDTGPFDFDILNGKVPETTGAALTGKSLEEIGQGGPGRAIG